MRPKWWPICPYCSKIVRLFGDRSAGKLLYAEGVKNSVGEVYRCSRCSQEFELYYRGWKTVPELEDVEQC